jgi:D-alanyl-lipoteichoic acid acyltransferase DltB (MBOAT superfamily)
MTFTSFSYFLFLPLVYLVFYFTKDRYRWVVLLTASYVFYATFKAPQLILALVLVTAVSYACGICLGRTTDEQQRKRILWFGVTVCVLLLIGIKLAPRFTTLLGSDVQSTYANLLLSIGISYFSFQAISYLADVYLEIVEPEPHLGYHALALAFFPKLLQGR